MQFLHIVNWFQVLLIPAIGMMVRVFANGPGDQGSSPGQVIPKTQKMVSDASLLNIIIFFIDFNGISTSLGLFYA